MRSLACRWRPGREAVNPYVSSAYDGPGASLRSDRLSRSTGVWLTFTHRFALIDLSDTAQTFSIAKNRTFSLLDGCPHTDVRYRPCARTLRLLTREILRLDRERHLLDFLLRLRRKQGADFIEERLESVSVDLPYELQSKIFDQLATVSVAGAGLSVTLIGSLLQNASRVVWLSVILFGLAAVTSVSANVRLIDGLTKRRPVLRRTKLDVQIAMGLIGMAIGFLSMSMYYEGDRGPARAASVQPAR